MRSFLGMWGACVLFVLGNQVALGQNARPYGPPRGSNANGRTIIFVAEGSNDSSSLAYNLTSALDIWNRPATIRSISWTRSVSPLEDYNSRSAQYLGAAKMVNEVRIAQQTSPNSAIVLMGFCSGSRVVLAATEKLPPGSVDKIMLFSPSVSSYYDLRPALRAARGGVDVFYNPSDNILERKEAEVGTADGARTSTAGVTSFLIGKGSLAVAGDPILGNLRQHDVSRYLGGHYASIRPNVINEQVIPLLPLAPLAASPLPPLPTAPPPYLPPTTQQPPPAAPPAPAPSASPRLPRGARHTAPAPSASPGPMQTPPGPGPLPPPPGPVQAPAGPGPLPPPPPGPMQAPPGPLPPPPGPLPPPTAQ